MSACYGDALLDNQGSQKHVEKGFSTKHVSPGSKVKGEKNRENRRYQRFVDIELIQLQ